MMFLYDLPNWLMGMTVVGACVLVILGAYFIFKQLVRREFSEGEIAIALGLVGVTATITSLLLAFSSVSAWESFKAADGSVMSEASDAAMLARDLAVYGSPQSLKTRAAVRDYAKIVVEEEWPLMSRGEVSAHAGDEIDLIFHTAGAIEPVTERDKVLLPEIWGRINDLVKDRRERIHHSKAEVPGTLWAVVVLGTALTFLFAFVLPANRYNTVLISGLACAMGLVFFFIIAMDHPFAGKEHISHEPFDSMIRGMDRWDALDTTAGPTH